jgi:hypothetical protein
MSLPGLSETCWRDEREVTRSQPAAASYMTLLRLPDLIGKFLNHPPVDGSRAVWVVPALLPVLQGLQRDSVSARKYRLAHARSLPDRFRIGKLNGRRAALVGLPVDMCNDFLHACDKLLVEIRECLFDES